MKLTTTKFACVHPSCIVIGLDRLIEYVINIDIDSKIEKKYTKIAADANEDGNISKYQHYSMDVIDNKSSSLLTHISIMIAISAYILDNSLNNIVVIISVIEISLYVLTAVFCLRCIRIIGPELDANNPNDYIEKIYSVVRFRRELYSFCLNSTVVLTTLLVPIFILHIVLDK